MKLFVIGIDGATFNVITPLIKAGKLPNIGRMISEGCSARLKSTTPPLSPVAWTTMITGASPAVHGIIDFIAYDRTSRQNVMFDSTFRKVDPIWTLADRAGKRSCVVNVPLTYPVDKLNGFMLSGLGTPPTTEGMAYPMNEFAAMEKVTGRYDVEILILKNDNNEKKAQALRELMKNRERCFDYLASRESWDFLFFVLTNTDRVQHFFWREHEEGSGPLSQVISETYEESDRFVGKAMAMAESTGGMVLVVSDHGFGPLNMNFSLSAWLHHRGLFTPCAKVANKTGFLDSPVRKLIFMIKNLLGKRLQKRIANIKYRAMNRMGRKFEDMSSRPQQWFDLEKTKVFSHKHVDTLFLYFNEKLITDSDQRAALIEELRAALLEIRDPASGKNIVSDVVDGRELFGSASAMAPDFVLLPANGCNFSFEMEDAHSSNPFHGIPHLWSGNHEFEGVFMAWGNHIRTGIDCGTLPIVDVMPTMCRAMDMAIPGYAEGKVIEQAFDESFLRDHEERRDNSSTPGAKQAAAAGGLSEEESAEVTKKLEALGYI